MSVLLITSLGDIVIDLHIKECPKSSLNFIKLCKIKYYNNCLFFDVQKDYIAQTGIPPSKSPTSIYGIVNGDSFKYFDDEITAKFKHNQLGIVASSNKGPNMNTSAFYIQLTNKHLTSLNNKHTIFGKVEEGYDVLEKINRAYCDENNRPYQNIRIKHTVIIDDPFDDLPGLIIPSQSPEPNQEETEYNRLEDDFDLNEFYKDKETEQKLKEKLREQDAKNKALILELLEDIPDSEIKPPENVLFVCKLNAITQDDDLENIFSRFGPIKSCQIIRDRKTGESLQYAFIEFEKVEDCEKAYLKMNGVIIDDKRIKVDFSQSVSKSWFGYNHNKGNGGQSEKANEQKQNEGNDLTLVNEGVKLEIKQNKNFNPNNVNNRNFVFEKEVRHIHQQQSHSKLKEDNKEEKRRKRKEYRSRSRSRHHHKHKHHHHH